MPVKMMNEKRVCGKTVEGFGDNAVTWCDYEIKCVCGRWTRDYGDVSMEGDSPDEHWYLCPACVAEGEDES